MSTFKDDATALTELKLFIEDENRDFSNEQNLILTSGHTEEFIQGLITYEDPGKTLRETYDYWLNMLQDFPIDEFLSMCHYIEGKPRWEA